MFAMRGLGSRCFLAVSEHGTFSTITAGIANKLGGLWQAAVQRVCSASLMLSVVLPQVGYRLKSKPVRRRWSCYPILASTHRRAGCVGELRCEGGGRWRLWEPVGCFVPNVDRLPKLEGV